MIDYEKIANAMAVIEHECVNGNVSYTDVIPMIRDIAAAVKDLAEASE